MYGLSARLVNSLELNFDLISSLRSGKQATYIPIVACVCLGFILVLTAGLIVVALIPVYLPKKSVTPNDSKD